MYSEYYKEPSTSRTMLSAFGGINRRARIGDGEFADMTNMTGDAYPLLSPRSKRTKVFSILKEDSSDEYENVNGILGNVGFAAVMGSDFYYMGEKVEGITLADGEKKLLAMGTDILIFPDTVYYNTVSGEFGALDTGNSNESTVIAALVESAYNVGRFDIKNSTRLPCSLKIGSTTIEKVTFIGTTSPGGVDFPVNSIIQSGKPNEFTMTGTSQRAYSYKHAMLTVYDGCLYYCSSANIKDSITSAGYAKLVYTDCEWTKVDVTSFRLTAEEFAATGFDDGDINSLWAGSTYIKISKDGSDYVITSPKIADILTMGSTAKEVLNGCFAPAARISAGAWRVKKFPAFDHACVHGNRLWGCRYGDQIDGSSDCNEIYCSVLGDFKDWTTGTGANDAYTLSVGEYGKFTGCVSLRGQLLFFKENAVIRVTGDKPSNISCDVISDNGLQEGCERSLEVIDNILYYKSQNGVYVYDGSTPYKISDALGNGYFAEAVAGKHFNKYYITMVQDGARKMYVYDTRTGLWHAEDGVDVRFFTEYEGALYGAIDNDIVCLSGKPAPIFTATEEEPQVEWCAETGDIGLDSPYQKYYKRILVRMDIELGARVCIDLSCNSGEWYTAADFTAHRKQSFVMPIITERCDHMKMRIRGKGYARIYSISYETEAVGDRQS